MVGHSMEFILDGVPLEKSSVNNLLEIERAQS